MPLAGQFAASVVDAGGADAKGMAAHESAGPVVQDGGIDIEAAAGGYRVAGVIDLSGAQAHVAQVVAAVVGIDAGFDHPAVDQLATRAEGDGLLGRQALRDLQVALGAQIDARGIGMALSLKAGSLDVYCTAGSHLPDAEVAVGIDVDVARAGGHVASQVHAHAALGAHQPYGVGIHAAQRGGIDGQQGLAAAVVGARGGGQSVGVDVVTPGDHRKVAGVDLAVDRGRASNHLEAVDVVGIDAGAVDQHIAAVDLKTPKPAVVE